MVVVATWNVENLFRPGEDPSGPTDAEAYRTKLDELAATIAATGADVVGLQEVGSEGALADLVDRLPGEGWAGELSSAPDGRGIAVAVVSRLPLSDRVDVVDLADGLAGGRVTDAGGTLSRMGRGALDVTVTLPDGSTLRLVTCHLKSKLLTFPGQRFSPRDEDERARYAVYALNRRAAEAGTVRVHANEVLDGQGRERALLVVGDLNDTPEAATTSLLLGPGGSEIGTAGALRPDAGDGARLWNLAPLIPEAERFSRVYRGRGELIDHVLVSRALLERVVDVRTTVPPPPAPGIGTGAAPELPSVTDNPSVRRDEPGSDHAPVVVRLSVG